jgi:Trk K+ transport system NAD-binding subunit
MTNWWRWQGAGSAAPDSFAVIGVGRFGTAVCKGLERCGAEVLAIDRDQRAIDALRQVDPAIEARTLDCTDEKVVFPSRMQGEQLVRQLVCPNLLERLRLDDRNSIEEIKVPQSFIGRSLRDLNHRKNDEVSVLAAGPENRFSVNPPASHVLSEGDLQVVMGTVQALAGLPRL